MTDTASSLASASSHAAATASPRTSAVTADHCAYCFDVILEHCRVEVPLPLADVTTRECFPLFITWKKRSASATPISQHTAQPASAQLSLAAMANKILPAFLASSTAANATNGVSHTDDASTDSEGASTSVVLYPASVYRLRGCIGTFSPRPLSAGLREYAITSAFRDHRFSPVAPHELPLLSLSVSLLTNFTPCSRWDDWTVGVHGITLDWRGLSATYLPEVAAEQGWSKEEAVEELARKAGWSSAVGEAERREMKVVRYESQKGHMSYEQYLHWKDRRRAKPADGHAAAVYGAARADGDGAKRTVGKRSRLEEDEDDSEEADEDGEEQADGVEEDQ